MEDEAIELDEFEIFKSRAYSKKKVSTSTSRKSPSRHRDRPERPVSANFDRTERQAPISEASIELQDDALATTPAHEECESLLQAPEHKNKVDRVASSPDPSRRRKTPTRDNQYLGLSGLGAGPSRLGRSYSCRPRSNRPHPSTERSSSRPRINSLAGSTTEVVRHSSLTSQNALLPNNDEFEIYRVRSFSTNNKGIVNRGDSFKIRSPMVRRPMFLESHDNLGSSVLSELSGSVAEGIYDDTQEEAESSKPPVNYRVLISGAQGVGKTALTEQFMTSEYLGNMDAAPDDTSDRKVVVNLDREECIIDFIDETAPEQDTVDANVIVFSVTDKNTFRYAEVRMREVMSRDTTGNAVVILVANKEDLVRKRAVTADEGCNLSSKYGCKYIEVSALLNHKVDDLLCGIVRQIRLRPQRSPRHVREHSIGGSSDSTKPFGCLPPLLVDMCTRLFKTKDDNASKSCENLLSL